MSKMNGSQKPLIGFLLVLIICVFVLQVTGLPVAIGDDSGGGVLPPPKSPAPPDTTATDTLLGLSTSVTESTLLLQVILEVIPILY